MRAAQLATICLLLLTTTTEGRAAIITHTTDFIADGSRTHFNGFESIPFSGPFDMYTAGPGPYVEDTIAVQQINSHNQIWTVYSFAGSSGSRAWYPNSGDHGYTTISLVGGGDFQSVGFNYSSGARDTIILFDLLNDGTVVLSGSANLIRFSVNYLGFSGGGFDLIRVRDNYAGGTSVTDGSAQALAIDGIETLDASAVPEPASFALFGFGGLGLIATRRHRQTS